MKKLLIILLAFVYIATSSGFAIYMHYCMGRIDSVNLVKSDDCAKCGMKTGKDCCKEELKVVKLEDSHRVTNNAINIVSPFIILKNTFKLIPDPLDTDFTHKKLTYNNSPPFTDYDLCIINNVFRI